MCFRNTSGAFWEVHRIRALSGANSALTGLGSGPIAVYNGFPKNEVFFWDKEPQALKA